MKLLLKLLALVLLASAVRADSIATIQLENRPAEEIIPVVKPLLGANDAISGEGFKIFLRSSPETLARVREMIEVIDTAAQMLQVSVFQGSDRELRELGISASITYSTDRNSASIGTLRKHEGLAQRPVHQVRVADGTEAYIETGQQVPFVSGAWVGPRGVAGAVEYRNVATGFYVLPRVRGENVVLEVSPFSNALSTTTGSSVGTQSASTTVTGRVGEWILIGGVAKQLEETVGSTGTRLSTEGRDKSGIWIRADFVK